ncbi:unnamed protein product [Amoebophrya sp. A120]|nr:unnamed protein product [Amoebophrya sp. A120]|eukprot:GSA120T00016345001.1
MRGMFRNHTDFDGMIGDWDVSSVRDMSLMFEGALSFDQYLGGWDVSRVTNMKRMFARTQAFTGCGIEMWDVSRVVTMRRMFFQATGFDGLEIGQRWDVSRVEDMREMFRGTMKFNQYIGDWDLGSARLAKGMLFEAIGFTKVRMLKKKWGDFTPAKYVPDADQGGIPTPWVKTLFTGPPAPRPFGTPRWSELMENRGRFSRDTWDADAESWARDVIAGRVGLYDRLDACYRALERLMQEARARPKLYQWLRSKN